MLTIIRRTVFESMKGMQFWLLLSLSVILFLTNGLYFSNRYTELRARYDREIASSRPGTVEQLLPLPPSPLEFMHNGDASGTPVRYKLQPKGMITPITENSANIKLPIAPALDWSFIITIVFCLFAVLIGYDSISGEREDGTLKLSLSNPISRARFGAAKFVAILSVLTVALLAGAIADILLIGAFHPEVVTPDTLASAGAVIAVSLLLCSLFAFLSIMISALSPSSPVALLLLLVIWAGFTVIMPNTAPVIARSFTSVLSELHIVQATQKILGEDMKKQMTRINADAKNGKYRSEEDLRRDVNAVYSGIQNRVLRQYEQYSNSVRERERITRLLACFSPVALYRFASENLTRTGECRDMQFLQAVRNYSGQYDRFILDKVGEITPKSNWTFSSNFFLNGREVMVTSPEPVEYKGDMHDFPKFSPPPYRLSNGLFPAFGDIAGLALWNLLAAIGAFAAVQRMDVR